MYIHINTCISVYIIRIINVSIFPYGICIELTKNATASTEFSRNLDKCVMRHEANGLKLAVAHHDEGYKREGVLASTVAKECKHYW